MRHLLAIPVGAVVCGLLGLILLGPDQFGLVLLLLVLCTVGLALIPLLFLCWAVGLLVLSFFPSKKRQPSAPAGYVPRSGEQEQIQAIAHFIRRARSQGHDDRDIAETLTRAGWYNDEIRAAWQLCEQGA